jgi:hypothetical protein
MPCKQQRLRRAPGEHHIGRLSSRTVSSEHARHAAPLGSAVPFKAEAAAPRPQATHTPALPHPHGLTEGLHVLHDGLVGRPRAGDQAHHGEHELGAPPPTPNPPHQTRTVGWSGLQAGAPNHSAPRTTLKRGAQAQGLVGGRPSGASALPAPAATVPAQQRPAAPPSRLARGPAARLSPNARMLSMNGLPRASRSSRRSRSP